MRQMPPLSFVDKLIYWLFFLLLCVIYFCLLLGPLYLRQQIAFSDASVIAAAERISVWWLILPWMTFFLMSFIWWLQKYQGRIPLFGIRNFRYGPPAWPKVYPLFMKNKPYVWVSQRKKQEKKQIAAALLILLLISFIPFPWSLYGRDCLYSDGSIVQYNMFNSQSRVFTLGDISEMEIETYHYSTGKYARRTHWGVRLVLQTTEGKQFTFDQGDFRGIASAEIPFWLEEMLDMKNRCDPAKVRYDGAEDLKKVIADHTFSQEAVEKLYQLFGQKASS